MNVFIAEDEAPARERLQETLAAVAPHARVVGWAATVREAREWLATHALPDLLLLDVQLADGLSLELFAQASVPCPTVFTTAYDEYLRSAFEARAIDYLLKPVDGARLAQALAKLEQLRRHFSAALLDDLRAAAQPVPQRHRLLARVGARHVVVPMDRIAYFVSADKLAFAVTWDGAQHLLDDALAGIEATLDERAFCRLNRRYVAHAGAVAGFRPAGKGRLAVDLTPAPGEAVVVSQERAAAVKAWLAS